MIPTTSPVAAMAAIAHQGGFAEALLLRVLGTGGLGRGVNPDGRSVAGDWTRETSSFRSCGDRLAMRSGTHVLQATRLPNRSALEELRSALVTRSWHLKQ
jgi:hypothetical protein